LNQAEVVACLLVVTNQNGPAPIQPAQRSLDDPAPRWLCLPLSFVQLLLADSAHVRDVLAVYRSSMTRRVIVPFVETQVLFFLIRFGPVDHNRFDRCLQELGIMNVGPGNDNTQGATIALND